MKNKNIAETFIRSPTCTLKTGEFSLHATLKVWDISLKKHLIGQYFGYAHEGTVTSSLLLICFQENKQTF